MNPFCNKLSNGSSISADYSSAASDNQSVFHTGMATTLSQKIIVDLRIVLDTLFS